MRVILNIIRPAKKDAWATFTKYLVRNENFIELTTERDIRRCKDRPEIILIPYGFNVATDLKAKEKYLFKNKDARVIRYFNEYDLSEMGFIKKFKTEIKPLEYICNFIRFGKFLKENCIWHTVNTNVLKFRNYNLINNNLKYDIIYYGQDRKNRDIYFRKYLNHKNIIVSTSKHNIEYFKNLGATKIIKPIDLKTPKSELRLFKYSLYLEDTVTHKIYNHPADRFYEALSYSLVLLFDKNCKNTFDTYGIDISEFIVDSHSDIDYFINSKHYKEFQSKQSKWKEIVIAELENVKKDIHKIINEKKYYAEVVQRENTQCKLGDGQKVPDPTALLCLK